MYLCDSCAYDLIRKNLAKPSIQIYGANGTRWTTMTCDKCGQEKECVQHPEARLETYDGQDSRT